MFRRQQRCYKVETTSCVYWVTDGTTKMLNEFKTVEKQPKDTTISLVHQGCKLKNPVAYKDSV